MVVDRVLAFGHGVLRQIQWAALLPRLVEQCTMAKDEPTAVTIRGFVYVVCLLGIFIEAGLFAANRRTTASSTSQVSQQYGEVIIDHPIPELMTEAEDKFRNMLERQSKTLEQAVVEYKKRYGRSPPKGFDEWFSWAVKTGIRMIDEYDAINEDLAPFWMFSGEELRRRIDQVR